MQHNQDGTISLSWDDIDQGAHHLINQSVNNLGTLKDQDIDLVVGIVRGGMVPAVIISHALDIPLIPVDYSSRRETTLKRFATTDNDIEHYDTILLVDDLTDSGHTMKDLHQHYSKTHHVITAVIVHKPESTFIPDYAAYHLPKDSGWVIFPYESDTIPNI